MAKPPKKHVFLFYCAECEELAQKIAAQSDSITLQTIKWRYSCMVLTEKKKVCSHFACFRYIWDTLGKEMGKRIDDAMNNSETPKETGACKRVKFYNLPTDLPVCKPKKKLRVIRKTFDDGFPNIYINNAQDLRGNHVAFLASFSHPGAIFEQISVIYNLPRLFAASFTLVLPFFPTGSFERMEEEGDVATAFTMARILSNIPISRGGPTSVVIYDIHALQERFYFGDNVLPLFETGIPLLKQRLCQLPDADNVVIAFPDDGAWKRFHKQLDGYPVVICTKVREEDKRIVRIKEGIPAGCHVVIVDDLVQSGGTLIECQKVLAAHGAAKVSAYVTHGVFPKQSWKRFLHKNGMEIAFSYFWITDSCAHTVKAIADKAPFEVLSLAGSIADALVI